MLIKQHFWGAFLFCLFFVKITDNLHFQNIFPQIDIILVGTNDIHGAAYPTILSRKDTGEKYTYGGLIYMAKIIEILKVQNQGNVLYLDAGDQFQGEIQSQKLLSPGQIISDYFNHMNLEANAIGNHEFDFGPQFLENYLSKLSDNILAANLIDTSNGQLPLKKQQRSKLYKFPIKYSNLSLDQNFTSINIGVIGLSTIETPRATNGFVNELFPSTYNFTGYTQKILEEAQKLNSQGAHAIVLVSHVGNVCNNNSDYGIWTVKNQIPSIPCQKGDQMFKLLDSLPDGLIDAVVQGHRHTQSYYFYKGIPIIGTINGGYYLNAIKLKFTLLKNTAYLQDDNLEIQGPIPVCERIFSETRKCEYVPPEELPYAGELISWKFHQILVEADKQLEQLYNKKYSQIMKQYQYKIVENYISTPISQDFSQNSAIGNLMTNVIGNYIIKKVNKELDFVILNNGGFRSTWYPGSINYRQLHSMIPFDNKLIEFKVSGKDLKLILQILQNGQKRYYPVWGLQQVFLLQQKNSLKQFPQQHHRHLAKQQSKHHLQQQQQQPQPQERHQNNLALTLKQLTSTLTSKPIKNSKIYTGITTQFLLNGGDDFSKIILMQKKMQKKMKKLQQQQKEIDIFDKIQYDLSMRDIIQYQMKEMQNIDQENLIGPGGMERFVVLEENR